MEKLIKAFPDDLEAKAILALALDDGYDRATRAPLTTIVAFSASNVTKDAICRSVNPGSVSVVVFLLRLMVANWPNVVGSVIVCVVSLRLPHALHK